MREIEIYGKTFTVADEPADFWSWVKQGNYNHEWVILEKLLRPEHNFIDLGAWVGSHSLYASTITKHVIAVEPDPVAFDILRANIVANGYKGTPVRVAITGYEGTITLGSGLLGASTTRVNRNAGGGIGAWERGEQFDIKCTTLRDFVKPLADPMFIKMDVEGSEEEILQDIEFFAEHKPDLYLETHPFWWKDEAAVWENIRKIAALYKHVFDLRLESIDLRSTYPRQIVFTDREF
jgi:FkbM family methyltransferase